MSQRYLTKASLAIADEKFDYDIEADLAAIEELAAKGLSEEQVAAKLKLNRSTFKQRADWQEAYHRGFSSLAEKILEEQITIAFDREHRNQYNMLIHLGKTLLKQREAGEEKTVTVNVDDGYKELLSLVK